MDKIKKIMVSSIALLMMNTGFSAVCHFKQPNLNTDVCKTLNLDNKVEENPFFLKNGNGLCGLNMQLSGLPDFSLKDYLPNFTNGDACKYLKYLTGDKLSLDIKEMINL
ncbi:hypothetical protein [Cysteiniphilum marinum]|uniref:hypothetical protein n=1 Tax=Cysteiniphilum marinum TaxID=2774191 RepID=UPI0019398AF1|nr:hypothetical protein [Cysteiniphilum marinum]